MNPAASLNAARRTRELATLAAGETVDLLVVGGGITGAGVALDAASRGLSVALVEKGDLAFGTSRWSSKLVHGGLRYIAQGQLGIAFESARERSHLLQEIAPHLVQPFPMLLPFTAHTGRIEALRYWLGGWVMDGMRRAAGTRRALLPSPRLVDAAEAARLVPALGPGLRGGLLYWDARAEDDARLVVAVARTAASFGARVLTYLAATALHPGGASVRDEVSGARFELRARQVVNATGVWAGQLAPQVKLRPSKGSHLVVRSSSLGDPQAAFTLRVPGPGPGRYVFVLPQPDGTCYLGLTDDPLDGPLPDEPQVTGSEQEFLLRGVSSALGRPLRSDEVVGSYAGLRPLLSGSARTTSDLSRRHAVIGRPGEVISIVGGKLTTYRRMAQDVVDRLSRVPCRTRTLPLVGAAPRAELARLASRDAVSARLVRRYGTEAAVLLELGQRDPALLSPVPGTAVLPVELLFGLLHEGALGVGDLLDRRLRTGLVPADRALLEPVARHCVERLAAAPAERVPG